MGEARGLHAVVVTEGADVGHAVGVVEHGDDSGRVFHEAARAVGHFLGHAAVDNLVVHEDDFFSPEFGDALRAFGHHVAVAGGLVIPLAALHGDASAHYLRTRLIGAPAQAFDEVGVHPIVGVQRHNPFAAVGQGLVDAGASGTTCAAVFVVAEQGDVVGVSLLELLRDGGGAVGGAVLHDVYVPVVVSLPERALHG